MDHLFGSAHHRAPVAARLGRRGFLQAGAAGVLGLTLTDMLALEAAGAVGPAAIGTDRACIVLWLTGGPSQLDSFDLKPEAPSEIRSSFKPIETNVPGIRICEHLPRLARHADKYSLLRSVHHNLDDHARGMCWLLAGRLHDSIRYPTMGSVVARLRPGRVDMPSFVTVPRLNLIAGVPEVEHSQTAGDLGAAWDPLVPDGVPGSDGFGIRDLALPGGLGLARFERRVQLLAGADQHAGAQDGVRSPRPGFAAAEARALDLIRSDRVRQAFDLDREPTTLRDRYGRHAFGQTALLARRLVETGVRFITVNWPQYYQWDSHNNNETSARKLLPILDAALGTLFEDLHERGLLERTLVLCMGEFGRTPRFNKDGGRDHWIHVMSVLMGGGLVRGGQVIGSSTQDGYPDARPVHAREVVATAYTALGIDLHAEMRTMDGRPIQVLPGAEPISELL
jgi:hypothetical protein